MASPTPETLDIEQPAALLAYLRATARIGPQETPVIRNLAGGVSNRTVLVERASGEAWVLKQALAKLRVKVDWFSDVARIHREALGLQWLASLAPPGTTTPLVFEDTAHHLLAMAAVPQPHDNFKTLLLAGALPNPLLLALVRQFGDLLGTIHRRSHEQRAELATVFDDRSFFESLRLEPYYQYTAMQVAPAAAFLGDLVARTRARRLTVVHGDFSPKNILVRNHRLVLLDHEVIHWGDPAFDLGFGLTHLLSKARHLPAWRRDLGAAAAAFWRSYREALGPVPWGDDLEAMAVRHTLGCMLARAMGRSPLEYLAPEARLRQRDAVLNVLGVTATAAPRQSQNPQSAIGNSPPHPPATIATLIDRLLEQP